MSETASVANIYNYQTCNWIYSVKILFGNSYAVYVDYSLFRETIQLHNMVLFSGN